MLKTKRSIPSLATLSVCLTGCGDTAAGDDDIVGDWDVTSAEGTGLPYEYTDSTTFVGSSYLGGGYFYSAYTWRGWMTVRESGAIDVSLSYEATADYYFPYDGERFSESYSCISTWTGTFLRPERNRFEIRSTAWTEVCEDHEGEQSIAQSTSTDDSLRLDCVLHPEADLLDCVDRTDGSYWSFERPGQAFAQNEP